nr:MAG TPA: hypothetical protein [Caudoviricetes sp.]
MKKYSLSSIMRAAWKFFRKGVSSFSLALRMAWANAKTQNTAKAATEITEETHTWYGWKELGYEVVHESKALYQASVSDPATKSGKRILSFFGASQVQPLEA